ncbi:MAG: ATP-dependent helicase [Hyphomicrobiales bacterium]
MKDILAQLNDAQRDAVIQKEGPSMVIAGAGSGKTRVLTYRIAYLLQQGADSFNILTLTFTNKAAREMKERIMNLIGGEARNIWMGTFHSVFARILRQEAHRLNYPSNFTIYDTEDAKRLIKKILKDHNLDPKVYVPNHILSRISGAKSNLISAQAYLQNQELRQQDAASGKPKIGELYQVYNQRLRKADAMDFDDLLYNTNVLLRDFPDVLTKYQEKFKYILVDEYQDTNYSQYLIIKKLAANNENICVVGDDAQSIYAFRGANIQNILNFKRDYPSAEIFKLEQNYRSTKNIVAAANSVIKCNKDQIKKDVWTSNDEGDRIKVYKARDEREEGNIIASSIFEKKMNYQLPDSDFAILYRTNAQSRSIEDALRKKNISYRIFGGLSFYKRREIKDLLAYFRLVTNPHDEDALLRVINYPARGIGNTSLDKAIIFANHNKIRLWDALEEEKLQMAGLTPTARKRIMGFKIMMQKFQSQLSLKEAYELAKDIASSSGLTKLLYDDKTPEGVSRYENLEELLNAIKEFGEQRAESTDELTTLDKFMEDIALYTDAEDKDKDNGEWVSLMTIHASKGLEFPYIFIAGLEENLFPSMLSLNTRAELEEERRLFYVALTRAEKEVALSFALNRYKWGQLTCSESSRFIEEIDERFVDYIGGEQSNHSPLERRANSRFSGFKNERLSKMTKVDNAKKIIKSSNCLAVSQIVTGINVRHEKFGEGKVLSVSGEGTNKKAVISFSALGQKQLLLKFAKLYEA